MNQLATVEIAAEAQHGRRKTGMSVLVVTSVAAEKEAVMRGVDGDPRFDVQAGGVGVAAAAASTAAALSSSAYDLVICAGIAGGFAGVAAPGELVVASEIVAADLGAETPEGFISLDELGFGSVRVTADASLVRRVTNALRAAEMNAVSGPILTVSTVTGTADTARKLALRVPGAAAEAMEGYGVAVAARAKGIPVLEIRAISNAVGPRDRAAWRMQEALLALERASSVIREVIEP